MKLKWKEHESNKPDMFPKVFYVNFNDYIVFKIIQYLENSFEARIYNKSSEELYRREGYSSGAGAEEALSEMIDEYLNDLESKVNSIKDNMLILEKLIRLQFLYIGVGSSSQI